MTWGSPVDSATELPFAHRRCSKAKPRKLLLNELKRRRVVDALGVKLLVADRDELIDFHVEGVSDLGDRTRGRFGRQPKELLESLTRGCHGVRHAELVPDAHAEVIFLPDFGQKLLKWLFLWGAPSMHPLCFGGPAGSLGNQRPQQFPPSRARAPLARLVYSGRG